MSADQYMVSNTMQVTTQPNTGVKVHTETIPGMGFCVGLLVLSDGKLLMCSDKSGRICSREPTWYTSATHERVYEEKIEALVDFDGILVHKNGTVVTCNRGVIKKRMPEISISQEKYERPTSIVPKYSPGNLPSYIVVDSNKHCLRYYMFDGFESNVFASGFTNPTSIVMTKSGQYVVADCGNHSLKLVNIAGIVRTLAGGDGHPGFKDGQGAAARFKLPFGLTLDEDGSILVADTGNNAVRRVTMQGIVSTVAGEKDGTAGCTDGDCAQARFNKPMAVLVLNAGSRKGSILVADRDNHCIREINTDLQVTTLAGSSRGTKDGAGPDARFSFPCAMAVDERGRLLVAEKEREDTLRVVEIN